MHTKKCPECAGTMHYCAPNAYEYGGYECGDCEHFERDARPDPEYDREEHDNGPTGHGEICYSDADPGL